MEHALVSFLSRFTYLAVIVVLTSAGMGVPVSEDLTLLVAGGLAARGLTDFWPTLAAGYFGVLFGDSLIYHWGKRMGPRAYAQPWVRRVLSLEREEKLRVHFRKHGALTVIVGRHTPGLRAPVFFLAGASGVGFGKFLLADAASAAVTVPIVVRLGFLFGEHLEQVRAKIHQFQWVLAGALLFGLAAWLLWRRRQKPPPDPV